MWNEQDEFWVGSQLQLQFHMVTWYWPCTMQGSSRQHVHGWTTLYTINQDVSLFLFKSFCHGSWYIPYYMMTQITRPFLILNSFHYINIICWFFSCPGINVCGNQMLRIVLTKVRSTREISFIYSVHIFICLYVSLFFYILMILFLNYPVVW